MQNFKNSNPALIYEDDSILVIDKPTGWIVNDAMTAGSQPTVQAWLAKNFRYPVSSIQSLRSGIVHRLDKETSGILLVAKTEDSFENLQEQFKSRKVSKTYMALVHGKIDPPAGGPPAGGEGVIRMPVGRLPWRRDRFGVLPGGREAITAYNVYKSYKQSLAGSTGNSYTLVEFRPQTGRTHQIRIHAKYIGHPIVSDEFYAGRKTARGDRKWCPRLFLHASKIEFFHPLSGKKVSFESDLPSDLKSSLEFLERLEV